MDPNSKATPYQSLKSVLSKHHQKAKQRLAAKHKEASEFLNQELPLEKLREHSTKLLTSAAFTANMLLPTSNHLLIPPIPKPPPIPTRRLFKSGPLPVLTPNKQSRLTHELNKLLPEEPTVLTPLVEQKISKLFKEAYGLKAVAELDGKRLNYSYGRTGFEQHLPRYPGDTIDEHDEWKDEGITESFGAWGYFAPSKEAMTEEDYLQEKYYLVAQTWLSPNWSLDPEGMYNWFKHRKMIMVNVENGRAVVGVLGDAGPAEWTGKVFGASPEAMYHLRAHAGWRNERVLLFFVDDPDDRVALGPIKLAEDLVIAER